MAVVPFSHASPFADKLRLPSRLFTFGGRDVVIQQQWRDDGRGGTELGFGASVYDAAFVLAEYLERHPDVVWGKPVVELGAGTGMLSVVARILGASAVWCTDGDEPLLALTRANVAANLTAEEAGSMHLGRLMWGDPIVYPPGFPAPAQLVLAADVAACPYRSAFAPLASTLRAFCEGGATVLLAYTARHASEAAFFAKCAREGLVATQVPSEQLSAEFAGRGIFVLELRVAREGEGVATWRVPREGMRCGGEWGADMGVR